MSLTYTIPPVAFAIAASEAARLHDEDCADVFDDRLDSRARLVAFAALTKFYPPREIALGFALAFGLDALTYRAYHAAMAQWWDDRDVDHVAKCLSAALRRPETTPTACPAPVFTPRKVRTIPASRIPKPRNVTAFLLGDPGESSARVARNERSRGV